MMALAMWCIFTGLFLGSVAFEKEKPSVQKRGLAKKKRKLESASDFFFSVGIVLAVFSCAIFLGRVMP